MVTDIEFEQYCKGKTDGFHYCKSCNMKRLFSQGYCNECGTGLPPVAVKQVKQITLEECGKKAKPITLAAKKAHVQGLIAKASALELELVWIPKIMHEQTDNEVTAERTEEQNGVGLSGVHAEYVTSIYKRVQAGAHLTDKMQASVKGILIHYWKQYAAMMMWAQTVSAPVTTITSKNCRACDNYYGADVGCNSKCLQGA